MNFEKIKNAFPKVREKEPLKQHSTFRVGGAADLFFEAATKEELMDIITQAAREKIPYVVIGRGTNCLFTDKGYRGLIIKNLTKKLTVAGTTITAESGALWAQIVNEAVKHNLTGMEPLYGLPGSIGAAVWGNAGVPGVETGSLVTHVELFNSESGLRAIDLTQPQNEVIFEYRHTSLQDGSDIVIAATLQLAIGNADESKAQMKLINQARLEKQPIGFSAGSFFKNPFPPRRDPASSGIGAKEQPAGMLIDQAGLKGTNVGDAEISTKHGNFFLNKGNATCADILALRDRAIKAVQEKFDITLHMEARLIGEL